MWPRSREEFFLGPLSALNPVMRMGTEMVEVLMGRRGFPAHAA